MTSDTRAPGYGRRHREMADRPQLEPTVVDGRRTGSRQGRTHHLGGAARPQRGRNRRKRRRDHHAAARRAGRRADRAGLRLHRRHRDPRGRGRCAGDQPRGRAARSRTATRQGRGAVAVAGSGHRRHHRVRRLRPDRPGPDVRAQAGRPAAHHRGRAPGQGLLPATAEDQWQRGRQRRWPGHRAGRAPAAGVAATRAELPACSRWAANTPAPASC